MTSVLQLSSPFGPSDKTLPAIRSIDYSDDLGKILVGTNNCDVIELTDTTNVKALALAHHSPSHLES